MQKIGFDQLELNPFTVIGSDNFLLTAGGMSDWNTMTAGWGGLGYLWGAPVAYVFVREERYTLQFMERCGVFTLSFFPPEMKGINGLMGIVIIVSAFGTALPVVFQGELYPAQEWSILFRVHLLTALAAYSFMTIAVVQAVLLTRKEREVANPATLNQGGLLSSMPSLLAMERILFRIVACGFVCLTLVLVLGAMATYELHQTYFIFEHKTILTWLSWIVFAVLLAGRYFLGWRKKKALAWFWAGIVFLAVAYLVYRFVLDALIH